VLTDELAVVQRDPVASQTEVLLGQGNRADVYKNIFTATFRIKLLSNRILFLRIACSGFLGTVTSFKFIIKVGYDFSVRLATLLTT
jgi:hypothetical protein